MGNLETGFSDLRRAAEEASQQATQRARISADRRANANPQWHVAHNGSGHDDRAIDTLERGGVEVYYPKIARLRYRAQNRMSQRQRRIGLPVKEIKFEPLFPRYFFVCFDMGIAGWHDVFELAGVHGIVFEEHHGRPLPALMPQSKLDEYRALEKAFGDVKAIPVEAFIKAHQIVFKPGETVRITEGVLQGSNAEVQSSIDESESLDESARVKLLVALFGRRVIVELPISDIEKLRSASESPKQPR